VSTATRPLPPVDEAARIAVATAAILLLIIVAGYAGVPSWRPWLREEGGLTEGLTAAALFASAVLGVWGIRRAKHREPAMWIVPAFALFALLDEIRYGVTWLGITPPTVAGEPIAGVADLVDVAAVRLDALGVRPWMLAIAVLATAGLAVVSLMVGPRGLARLHALGERPWLQRLAASIVLALVAAALDLIAGGHLRFAEEAAELTSAFLLTLAALTIPSTPTPLQRWRSRLEPWTEMDRRAAA
jgi:hypothetical protein